MTDFDNTNRGALFKNDKEGNENRPDYKGPMNVNGEEWQIAAWLKTDRNGKKFMSVTIQPKQSREPGSDDGEDDSEVPF
jgi:uncharacterized protein (DUF736 family)